MPYIHYIDVVLRIWCGNFFFHPRPACCETEEGGEGERGTCKMVEVYCPAAICFTYLPDRWKEVQEGVPPLPPVTHTPFQRIEATAMDL
jgi:hypothetical protein